MTALILVDLGTFAQFCLVLGQHFFHKEITLLSTHKLWYKDFYWQLTLLKLNSAFCLKRQKKRKKKGEKRKEKKNQKGSLWSFEILFCFLLP